jgi:hypothetical protein
MHKLIVTKCTVACALANFFLAHYFEHNFLSMFTTPRHLKLFACGSLLGDFVNNPLEGYRTLVPIKITQNPLIPKNIRQGGASKGEA